MNEQIEHELKLTPTSKMQAKLLRGRPLKDVDRVLASIRGLLGAADFKIDSERVRILSDEYFDTTNLALYSAGAILRVRREGLTIECALKSTLDRKDGLLKRKETIQKITESDYRTFVNGQFGLVARLLSPDFANQRFALKLRVRNERRDFVLRRRKEKYCFSFDTYSYVGDGANHVSRENIEIELEAQSEAGSRRLPSLREQIGSVLPEFTLSSGSKYERGIQWLAMRRGRRARRRKK